MEPGASTSCGGGRVRLNVGGTLFETSVLTLGREPESMLARLLSSEWEGGEAREGRALFIDRDPRHFPHILNFLRDGPAAALPSLEATDQRRALAVEADFFGLRGLSEVLRRAWEAWEGGPGVGQAVGWRAEAVEDYWRPFALSLIQEGVELAFQYERVGKKYSDKQTVAGCVACQARFVLDQITVFDYKLRFDEWAPLRQHMRWMRGSVVEVAGPNCALVLWDNGKRLHLPKSALRALPSPPSVDETPSNADLK